MAPANPTTHPAPETLESALGDAGLTARLLIERRDRRPLDANDRAALRAIVACHDAEHRHEVSDDKAMAAVAAVLEQRAKKTDDAAQ